MFVAYASFYSFDDADSARRRVVGELGGSVKTELRRPTDSYSSPSDVPEETITEEISSTPAAPGLLPGSMLYIAAPAVAQSGIPEAMDGGIASERNAARDAERGEYVVRVFGDTQGVEKAAKILRSAGGINVMVKVLL